VLKVRVYTGEKGGLDNEDSNGKQKGMEKGDGSCELHNYI
jgi:hypothetical protein